MRALFMFSIASLLLALAASQMIGQESERDIGMAAAQSENFIVYRDAMREYMLGNPGHTGIIATADLDLPRTFVNMGWANEANAGEAWVYGNMVPEGLRRAVSRMGNPMNVGRNVSGVLVSPVHGNTGIIVPGFVPVDQVAAVVVNNA